MSSLLLFIVITLLVGVYFYTQSVSKEGFSTSKTKSDETKTVRCPDLLIQQDSKIYLYNSKLATVPGVNPVVFDNLEDYVEFLDWQHSQGIHCPVLFLQKTYDAQGTEVYKIRPNILNPQGGTPPISAVSIATPGPGLTQGPLVDVIRNQKKPSQTNYPGYDPMAMENIPSTPMIQQVKTSPISPDPMDDNWGGANYTQSLVDEGYYAGNEVSIRVA